MKLTKIALALTVLVSLSSIVKAEEFAPEQTAEPELKASPAPSADQAAVETSHEEELQESVSQEALPIHELMPQS